MTQAIEKVEQTELGALVARREELNAAVAEAKRNLRNYRNWHAPSPENVEYRTKYYRDELARWAEKLAESEADLAGLKQLSAYANSDSLKTLIGKLIVGVESDVKYQNEYITSNTKRIADEEQATDPRIPSSNALAAAEAELETVRQQIKEARSAK